MACRLTAPTQGVADGGVERMRPGPLEEGILPGGWEAHRVGRAQALDRLQVECVRDATMARSGSQFIRLAIPAYTVGFEYVTVGQRVPIVSGRAYTAGVWVRWPDGPPRAPRGADRTSGHRSAIVSFWARNRDGTGTFAGRDVWLFDNRWKHLTFTFCASEPDDRVFLYVSLLPNQRPSSTVVIMDDLSVSWVPLRVPRHYRVGELAADTGFSGQHGPTVQEPWSFSSLGGSGIRHSAGDDSDNRVVRMSMAAKASGLNSAQVWQFVRLVRGLRYRVSCRIRWDNFDGTGAQALANFGVYDEASDTWYGPIDVTLEPTAEWRQYAFTLVAPRSGKWKIYVALNGWGNAGRALDISVDDVSCRAVAAGAQPRSKSEVGK